MNDASITECSVVRRSVHKLGYGHKQATATPSVAGVSEAGDCGSKNGADTAYHQALMMLGGGDEYVGVVVADCGFVNIGKNLEEQCCESFDLSCRPPIFRTAPFGDIAPQ